MDKECKKCGKLKPLSDFYVHKMMLDGYLNFCKECVKLRISIHYHRNGDSMREKERARFQERKKGKVYHDYINLHRHDYPNYKKNATNDVRRKLTYKGLRPDKCLICGTFCIPEGHHPDYSKPLEVIWCCSICHKRFHHSRYNLIKEML